MTTMSITPGQLKQIRRLMEDAVDRGVVEGILDKANAQALITKGDEFQSRIIAVMCELTISNQFASEEAPSKYGYFSGYKPNERKIDEQVRRLHALFPNLGSVFISPIGQWLPPDGVEGWFAIPRWQSIAPTYGEAVELVLNKIMETRGGKFRSFAQGVLGPQYLRQSTKTVQIFQNFGGQQQGHDILVIPAQFGLRHRGRSTRRAREVMRSREFGLGAFAIGIMLLTHPERLQHFDDLWIDCAGDEFSPVADGHFGYVPFFRFSDNKVCFGMRWAGNANEVYGSASGFVI